MFESSATNRKNDKVALVSMLLFFFASLVFIINLKKESDTIRNCSSNTPPFPEGVAAQKTGHCISVVKGFIGHL